MRSLGTIRARFERLASGCLPSPGTLFLHWVGSVTSGARPAPPISEAPAQAMALAEAVAARAPGEPPPTVVSYSTDDLTTCPRA